MKILCIYLEPARYILDFVLTLKERSEIEHLEVVFLSEGTTQPWSEHKRHGFFVVGGGYVCRLRSLLKVVGARKWDYVHLAGWGSPLLIFVLVICAVRGLKVSMESDTQFHSASSLFRRSFKTLLYPLIFKFVHLFFPGGVRQVEYLVSYGVDRSRIYPYQMTVSVENIDGILSSSSDRTLWREKIKASDNHIVFVFLGRLVVWKGVEDLLNAFKRLDRSDVRLVFIGDGPLSGFIDKACSTDSRVYNIGRLELDSIVSALYSFDALVLPSHFEPWGLVVNEAMACGLPVLASRNVGCVDDLLQKSGAGFVFNAGDVDDLYSKMNKLAESSDLREKMGYAARRVMSSWTMNHSVGIVVEAWSHAQKSN